MRKKIVMRHGSLFSGIGGFDLAATWMGWDNVFNCEKDGFCRRLLNYYWPHAKSFEDARKFSAIEYRGLVDIISGGFPCQPFSQAGKRKGTNDNRYLWPETLRLIKEARPCWIVLENVAGLFTILEQQSLSEMELKEVQLFCENDSDETSSTIIRIQRRVIGTIIADLWATGYFLPELNDGTPVVLCIPACAVNAPHRRDRVWIVAHTECGTSKPDQAKPEKQGWETLFKETDFLEGRNIETLYGAWASADNYGNGSFLNNGADEIKPSEAGQQAFGDIRKVSDNAFHRFAKNGNGGFFPIPGWDQWPVESPFYGRNDGIPSQLDGITIPKWEEQSLKGFGNAIVPQVAFQLFQTIESLSRT